MSVNRDAIARLVRNRDGSHSWVIDKCPFCGRRHSHGGGDRDTKNPRSYLGWREPHCVEKTPGQYRLIEAAVHGQQPDPERAA